jgi:hypothetical protein
MLYVIGAILRLFRVVIYVVAKRDATPYVVNVIGESNRPYEISVWCCYTFILRVVPSRILGVYTLAIFRA